MSHGLEALNVVEVSHTGFVAAMTAKLLADLGATVVKIEPPEGDIARRRGPFRDGNADSEASGSYLYLNANKRSLALDLTQPDGRQGLDDFVRRADLLVHDVRPSEMARHGLDYDSFKAINPRLVMVSVTPFGLTGPYRDYVASDLTLYHGGGLGWLCPGKGTPLSRPPIAPFGQHAYAQGALHAAVAGLAACFSAADSGVGEHVDVSRKWARFFSIAFSSTLYRGDRVAQFARYEPRSSIVCKTLYYLRQQAR